MGLDMYLKRANLHGYTPKQAKAASAYYSMMEHNKKHPEDLCTSLYEWEFIDDSLLDMGAVEALRPEYQQRYLDFGFGKPILGYPDVFEQVGYWRKANAIHSWFVGNVQDNHDDCEIYLLTRAQLEELKSICELILSHEASPNEALPACNGFFFGSTEYDEDYYSDLRKTVEIIDSVIAETDWEVESICYEASW